MRLMCGPTRDLGLILREKRNRRREGGSRRFSSRVRLWSNKEGTLFYERNMDLILEIFQEDSDLLICVLGGNSSYLGENDCTGERLWTRKPIGGNYCSGKT